MENSNGKLIGALLVGAVVGAAAGVLFAPDKGSKTRKAIADKSEDLTDTLKDKFNEFMESIKTEYEGVKDKAKTYAENGHAKKEEIKSKM